MKHRTNSKRGFTAVELVLVIVVLTIVVSVTMWQVDKRRQAELREESAANLKAVSHLLLGRVVDHALDHNAGVTTGPVEFPRWPPVSATPGQLIPEITDERMRSLVIPEGPTVFISPAHPKVERMRRAASINPASAITDDSYWYLGYVTWNEDTGLAFVDAYKDTLAKTGLPPSGEVLKVVPLDAGVGDMTNSLPRLGRFPENASLNDFWPHTRPIPVMIERPGLQRGGSNVLFFGGHVEFIPYPGKWPMTEKFIKALESLDALKEKQ